jgi:hypothetical protein
MAGFPKARLVVPTPIVITTVAVSLRKISSKSLSTTALIAV